jgi:aspartyl protease family protein
VLVWALFLALPAAGVDSVAARLRALADSHGFRLVGIEKIGAETTLAVQDDLVSELRQLLAGYNHVLDGVPPTLRRVIILSAKQPAPRQLVAKTTRRQGQHIVQAALLGERGQRASVDLIVDTGASSIVLPESMMAALGFDAKDLAQRRGQTVNGVVDGKIASLASVTVGGAVARDVAVLFVADDLLGGVSLLGMSFLDRFSFTINKAENKLMLAPR